MDYIGLAEQLVTLATRLKSRYDAIQENPGAADALLKSFELMASHLQSLNDLDRNTLHGLAPQHRKIHKAELERLEISVGRVIDKLQLKIRNLDSTLYATTHAIRNEMKFEELEEDAERNRALILQISSTLATAEKFDR